MYYSYFSFINVECVMFQSMSGQDRFVKTDQSPVNNMCRILLVLNKVDKRIILDCSLVQS